MVKTKKKVKRDTNTENISCTLESGAIIQTFDLKKSYNIIEGVDVKALDGVSIAIKKGEFVSVMGPSGSGKTTLLNMIGALDVPSSGSVFINGIDVACMDDKERTDLRLKEIGFIFQFYNLVPVLTAYENVELPMIFAGKPVELRKEKVNYFMDLVGISDRKDFLPSELSGGEQQRVAIARSLSNEPAIIIADEPTGELDTKMGMEIIQLLRDLNKELNQTILMVTHDPDVGALAERILRMRDGKIIDHDMEVHEKAPEKDVLSDKLTEHKKKVEKCNICGKEKVSTIDHSICSIVENLKEQMSDLQKQLTNYRESRTDELEFHKSVNDGAYYISQKGYTYEELCWLLAESHLKIQMNQNEIPVDLIKEKAENIHNTNCKYDELCWLIAELGVMSTQGYFD